MTRPLLSRIAETLYWIGRYVERADDTARLLDVSVHRVLDEPETCRSLYAVLGLSPAPFVSTAAVMRRLAHDLTEPASIASSIRSARDSAREAPVTLQDDRRRSMGRVHPKGARRAPVGRLTRRRGQGVRGSAHPKARAGRRRVARTATAASTSHAEVKTMSQVQPAWP
ncbi:alpha-E domain-containing protein [Nonomuraea aridisoli]|uniref:alpha-E domain-containing protein n=1 Tax=Nonomuraea aridisoli TaxID=2070368 RepID=UPI001C653B98|nr:alpha-E domain-containing protein [Nonomuraea aridisoli]